MSLISSTPSLSPSIVFTFPGGHMITFPQYLFASGYVKYYPAKGTLTLYVFNLEMLPKVCHRNYLEITAFSGEYLEAPGKISWDNLLPGKKDTCHPVGGGYLPYKILSGDFVIGPPTPLGKGEGKEGVYMIMLSPVGYVEEGGTVTYILYKEEGKDIYLNEVTLNMKFFEEGAIEGELRGPGTLWIKVLNSKGLPMCGEGKEGSGVHVYEIRVGDKCLPMSIIGPGKVSIDVKMTMGEIEVTAKGSQG